MVEILEKKLEKLEKFENLKNLKNSLKELLKKLERELERGIVVYSKNFTTNIGRHEDTRCQFFVKNGVIDICESPQGDKIKIEDFLYLKEAEVLSALKDLLEKYNKKVKEIN